MNTSHAISLFTNSCHYIPTNGKAPPHPHTNQQHARNVSFPNHSQWKTKFSCFTLPPTQHHSFIVHLPPFIIVLLFIYHLPFIFYFLDQSRATSIYLLLYIYMVILCVFLLSFSVPIIAFVKVWTTVIDHKTFPEPVSCCKFSKISWAIKRANESLRGKSVN